MKLTYNKPAKNWMREALPIGNAYVGAMLFGGTHCDSIQFSYEGLWSGGPAEGSPYNYGIKNEAWKHIEKVRELLRKGNFRAAHRLANKELTGEIHEDANPGCTFGDYGAQQTVGTLVVKTPLKDKVTNYCRELDLERAVSEVSFSCGGNKFQRTYFASYPHKVLAYRYQSSEPVKYSLHFETPHVIDSVRLQGQGLLIRGHLRDNKRKFSVLYNIKGAKARLGTNNVVELEASNDIKLFQVTGSDYENVFPKYKNEDYEDELLLTLYDTGKLTFDGILKRHVEDYQTLFNRSYIKLGGVDKNKLTTDQRISEFFEDPTDVGLINIYFQYARYLMISGSRPGSLPLHLQGKWNNLTDPMWACDYHFNINLQMCYWPAEITNLAECHTPLLSYLESIQEPGRLASKEFFGTRGWMVNTMNNAYGFTATGWEFPWGFFPVGAAWSCRHLWEHYLFNNDTVFLKEKAYPLMKDAALFWLDYLIENEKGDLASMPSYSPEHGGISMGANMDHQIAWDLLNNLEKAHRVLDISNDFSEEVSRVKQQIVKPQIGHWGQLQEWIEDVDDPNNKHRHVSHLYALYPGNQITVQNTPAFAEACKVSLNARGDEGTGWSRAWKINFWTRLKDGNRAFQLICSLLKHTREESGMTGGTYDNLLCAHPPFQLDGNMGGAAGIAEMLVQSHEGLIDILPALPDAWASGEFKGLKARGGVEVWVVWKDHRVTSLKLRSKELNACMVRVNGEIHQVNIENTNWSQVF